MTYFLSKLNISFAVLCFSLFTDAAHAQLIVSGTVYDSTKIYPVSGVIVKSTSGSSAVTDTLGAYQIVTTEKDSLSFFYGNKPTMKFPVNAITNYTAFDISLRVRVNEKYKFLKEVKIFSKNYRQDSAENRLNYAKVFDYHKPGLSSTYTPGGSPEFDLDELINIFHFKRNKLNLAFQQRLIDDEQQKYVDYRFNTIFLKRITGLSGDALERYKFEFRPSYMFLITATELEFYEYILNTSAKFKKANGIN